MAILGANNFSISRISLLVYFTCTFTFDVDTSDFGAFENTIFTSHISNDQNIPLGSRN